MVSQDVRTSRKKWIVLGFGIAVIGGLAWAIQYASKDRGPKVDFSTEVKPILNKNCISCHGGVKAKGGFSVLFEEEAFRETESGKPAIIRGNPDASEMIRRLTLDDPELRMPHEHDPLSEKDIATLRRWIKQGAPWGDHWAYLPVRKPANAQSIDAHIQEQWAVSGIKAAPPADAPTLLRRVSLDLIGLYPTAEQSKTFLNAGNTSTAYELLVDSLLSSPRFGEKWASMWLDIARYADTKGYESDGHRHAWPYRDWVIKAFNSDMPYDQFIIEQMAGDMLPNPTDDQLIATTFHRNSMTNDEGGTDNEEFRVAAVMDRINTSWEGIMSTTFACVQCHSHPYDPFKHDEYYKFFAFFNNTRDEDVPNEYPHLRQLTPEHQRELDELNKWIVNSGHKADTTWVKNLIKFYQPAVNSTTADELQNAVIGNMNYALMFKDSSSARFRNINLENAAQMVWQFNCSQPGGTLILRLDSANGPIISTSPIKALPNWRYETVSFPKQSGVHDVYVQFHRKVPKGSTADFTVIFNWLAFVPAFPGKDQPGYSGAYKKFWDLITANVPGIPIMYENPESLHRTTRVFERGNRLTLGDEVQPAVPASLVRNMQMKTDEKLPGNRLELAYWMMDTRNPLVARTMVNRIWEQLFGVGLVETLEDMGTQGANPTHVALLDELSWKFMHTYSWSIKKLIREIVTSGTYKQDSKATQEQLKLDPENKYYARGPRVRLSAEQIRDQHLQVSGVLSIKMYGPSVMPWQPDGIWLSPYNGSRWAMSEGEDQYRRAVYTYWKRSSPYPSMMNFDGAQRVVCSARRIRTNTPLQALVTLNDSVYIDLARQFAQRMDAANTSSVDEKIGWGYEVLLFKKIQPATLAAMRSLYDEAERSYTEHPEDALALIGLTTAPRKIPAATLVHQASMVLVANAMLNMDEVVVKN